MYVDDDQALVFLIARVLGRKGFVVTTYTDPHAAQTALQADPQAFDLLVTDYNMPGMYMPNLTDEGILTQIKKLKIVLVIGQEDPFLDGNQKLSASLTQKNIPHEFFISSSSLAGRGKCSSFSAESSCTPPPM